MTAISLGVALWSTLACGQQSPAPGGDQALQEIIVTGSLIKRTDIETPSPVQMLSADDIKKMGFTTISQVLGNLSANGQGTLNQSFSSAFASGGSGIALRGLSVGDTLTLIDGQRMVAYPISDDNQRSFVDISAIPVNAVERIEVLKDGASAEYGADAIAGVVNIILKKSYTGTEFAAEAGTSQKHDGTTEHLSVISGIGDLPSDGYNAYIAIDFNHEDEILATHRHGGFTNLDLSSLPGGINATPGAYGDPNVAYPRSTTGYLINPSAQNPDGSYANGLPGEAFLPGCSAAQQQLQQCTFRYSGLQLQPATSQTNVLAKFTKAIGNDWTTSVTASLFNSKAEQVGGYNTTAYSEGGPQNYYVGPGLTPAVISTPVYTVPANYPGNPYGAAAPLVGFPVLADRDTLTSTSTYRFIWDMKGSAGGFDIDGSLGIMYSRMQLKELNFYNVNLVQNALNNGYLVGPSESPQLAQSIAPQLISYPTSSLDTADIHASKALLALPNGPLTLAAGAQFFHKVENYRPPAAFTLAEADNGNPAFSIGSQNDAAAFAEVDAQILKQLEIDGAVRYDNYNNGLGSSTTPKLSVKFKPIDALVLRGTWGKGFRAPSIAEGGQSGTIFYGGNTNDPILCPNPNNPNAKGNFPSQCNIEPPSLQQAGANLKPVKSTNETFGFIVEPSPMFNVSADYYWIKLTDDIISAAEAGGINTYTSLVRGASATLPFCTANNVCTQNVLTPVGEIGFLTFPYINAGEVKTEGVDVDAKAHFDLGVAGRLSAELNYTHVIEWNLTADGVTYDLAGTHGPSGISGDTGNPKDRAVLTLTWDKGPVTVSATVNYTSHFSVVDPSEGESTCAIALQYGDGRFTAAPSYPGYLCNVPSFVSTNLYGSYAITDNFVVHGTIQNLFNAQAPIDEATYGGGGGYPYDASLNQAGAIGRFFLVGASYKF